MFPPPINLDPIIKIPRAEEAKKINQRVLLMPSQGFLDSFKSLSLNWGFNLGLFFEELLKANKDKLEC